MRRIAETLGAAMFAAIFLGFLLQITARYVFAWPIGWPDETITILFVWVVFWGGALMVPLERQISFDLLHDALPPRIRRLAGAAALALTGVLFAAAIPVTVDYLVFSHRMRTPVLDVPLSLVYAPVLLFLVSSILRIAFALVRALRG